MKCIYCGCKDSKVIDSRSSEDGQTIRRRRECALHGEFMTADGDVGIEVSLVVEAYAGNGIDAHHSREEE